MEYLKVSHLSLRSDTLDSRDKSNLPILSDILLNIKKGEIFGIVGPTGAGKSVLLRAIAGVLTPEEGSIFKEGLDITETQPYERKMSMVFQNYALYPHLSAGGNIKMPIRSKKKGSIYYPHPQARIDEIARLLHLDHDDLINRRPGQISGGEKQRVALGKAIAVLPEILLLDEPLSNIEANFRYESRMNLRRLIKDNNITAIYVSHNQIEIGEICDRIALMNFGRIEQVGTFRQLYDDPKTLFTSVFMGEKSTNFLSIEETKALTGGKVPYSLTIRPDECLLGQTGNADDILLKGEVSAIENHFDEKKKILFLERAGSITSPLFGVEVPVDLEILRGDIIEISVPLSKAKFFDESGERIYNLW